MQFLRLFFLIVIMNFPLFQNTPAQTVLSSRGLGTPFDLPNARSMGMGGISIALADPITISRTNPAGLLNIKTTRLSIQYFYEKNNYRDEEGSASSQYSNFDGFNFAIPFGSGAGLSLGLAPLTRVSYNLSFREELAGEDYSKSVQGQGGLNAFTLSLTWALRSNLSLGLSGHYIFGKLKESWKVDFDQSGFISSTDIFSTKNWGYGFTAGFTYRPFSPLLLGAVFTPKVDLNNRTETQYIFKSDAESHRGSLSYPTSWGIGSTFNLGKIGILGVEFLQRNWTELAFNGKQNYNTRKTRRISLGCEILPNGNLTAHYLTRVAYRFGFSYQPYFSLDPRANTIKELWATMGLGLPLLMHAAQIDVAIIFGKRGSIDTNGLSENLFRVSVSVTGGERWFIRRY